MSACKQYSLIATTLTWVLAGCGGEIGSSDEQGPRASASISLTASPKVVSIANGRVGTTTIRWNRSGAVAYITVSRDGGAEKLFASGQGGSTAAPWIVGGSRYVFRMRTAAHGGRVLSTVMVTTSAPASYDDFAPYKARYGGQIGHASGGIYSQWASRPLGGERIDVSWGDPKKWTCPSYTEGCPTVEEHGIKRGCSAHGDWIWLSAYRNDHVNHRYRIRTTKAVLIRGGKTYDITRQCGTDGQPYALTDVSQPYVLKVWGDILDNDGNLGRRFYWEHLITPPKQVQNSCWQGSGAKTRLAIRQDELWWDSHTGWAIGGGEMKNGEPSGNGSWYGRYQTMARDVGFGWTLATKDSPSASYKQSCLYHHWRW